MQSVAQCPNPYLWGIAATQNACSWMPPPVPSAATMDGAVMRPAEGRSSLGSISGAHVAGGMVLRGSDDLLPSQTSSAPCSWSGGLGFTQPAPSTPKRREASPWSGSPQNQQTLQAEPRTPPQNRVGSPGSFPSTGPRTPACNAERIEHLKLGRTPSPEAQYRRPSSYSSMTPASMQFSPFQLLPPPMHSVLGCPSTPSAGAHPNAGTALGSFNSITPPSFLPPGRLGPFVVTPTPPVPFATPPQMRRPGMQSHGLTPGPVRHPGLPPTQLDYSDHWVEAKRS